MKVIVIMCDRTVVQKKFKSPKKAQQFAQKCRASFLVSLVLIKAA